MSRKRGRNSDAGPMSTFHNPLSRDEEEFGGGGQRRRFGYDDEDDWKNDMYSTEKRSISLRKGRNQKTEVLVSNLDKELEEDDVMTIFEKLGCGRKVTSVSLTYDKNGNSLGTAIVVFKSAYDAEKCVGEHDGVVVDDLAMSLKIVGGGIQGGMSDPKVRGGAFGSALFNDDDDYPRYSRRGGRGRRGGKPTNGEMRSGRGRSFSNFGGNRRGGRGTRGGRRGGRGGRGRGGKKDGKPKSAADLDKELDNYMKRKTGGKGNKKSAKSVEDLDAELENYAKMAAAKKAKASENGEE